MANRVILITGASSGIGHAAAAELIARGHTVYGAARRVEAMHDLVAAGGHALAMDVQDDASVRTGVDRVVAEQGRIDALFANAGHCLLGQVETVSAAEAARQLDVNVVGVGRAIAAVLPHMRARASGTILINSSPAAHLSAPGMAWYAASKHALEGLASGLRMELAEFGLHVSVVEPGYVVTGIGEAGLATLDRSEHHPAAAAYADQRRRFRANWISATTSGAPPERLAPLIAEILTADAPRPRYQPDRGARRAILLKRLFGDRRSERHIAEYTLGERA